MAYLLSFLLLLFKMNPGRKAAIQLVYPRRAQFKSTPAASCNSTCPILIRPKFEITSTTTAFSPYTLARERNKIWHSLFLQQLTPLEQG